MPTSKSAAIFWLALTVIAFAGAGLVMIPDDYQQSYIAVRVAAELGHAFIIAAVLAAIVDTYLKRHLVSHISRSVSKEVVKNVAPFIYGELLPREVQEEMNRLREIPLVRRATVWRTKLKLIPSDSNNFRTFSVNEHKVENLALAQIAYSHHLAASDITGEKIVGAALHVDGRPVYQFGERDLESGGTDREGLGMGENRAYPAARAR